MNQNQTVSSSNSMPGKGKRERRSATLFELSTPGKRKAPSQRRGVSLPAAVLLALVVCAVLTGCFGFLKPARSTSRNFVLTPLPATGTASAKPAFPGVGVGQVKVPAYILNSSLAVRKGTNEVTYPETVVWAERLDTGFQRVLAADLGVLLPTDQIRLSTWRKEEVAAEAYVTLEQFDIDTTGKGVLIARWRILTAGGEHLLKAGESRLSQEGPPPDIHPSGAVATLSELVAELSRQLAEALHQAVAAPK
jgi:uncharacterized lipoprotein YmbA